MDMTMLSEGQLNNVRILTEFMQLKDRVRQLERKVDGGLPLGPCPSWCELAAGHSWDSIHDDGHQSRGHSGPSFGDIVSVGASEDDTAPGVLEFFVSVDPTVEVKVESIMDLAHLIQDLEEARAWLLCHDH
jgi:hypothetical protein